MSSTTLETLRADYEAARQAYDVMDLVAYAADPDGTLERRRKWIRAANIYAIAQDHGLNAAMLYKLSDGAIRPDRP